MHGQSCPVKAITPHCFEANLRHHISFVKISVCVKPAFNILLEREVILIFSKRHARFMGENKCLLLHVFMVVNIGVIRIENLIKQLGLIKCLCCSSEYYLFYCNTLTFH